MLERPGKPKMELGKVSLEANVKMPQNSLGITLLKVQHFLDQEHIDEALKEVVAPIPLDERIMRKTEKAQAQHAHHGIARRILPEEVRGIEVRGNLEILNFLAGSLEIANTREQLSRPKDISEDGSWESPEVSAYVEKIKQALTPEKLASLRRVVKIATQTLESPEIKEKLSERKKLYTGFSTKPPEERNRDDRRANRITNDIFQEVTSAIFHAGESNPEDRRIATFMMGQISKYAPGPF